MTHTNGLLSHSPELIKHIEALQKMNANIESYSADGGYDSFLNHVIYGFISKQNQLSLTHQIL